MIEGSLINYAVSGESEREGKIKGSVVKGCADFGGKKKYDPVPILLPIAMSSHEMYGDSSDRACIPSKSHVQFSFVTAQKTLAFNGSSFSVQENFAKISIVFVSFTERRTV